MKTVNNATRFVLNLFKKPSPSLGKSDCFEFVMLVNCSGKRDCICFIGSKDIYNSALQCRRKLFNIVDEWGFCDVVH